jgi:hypothetical protein
MMSAGMTGDDLFAEILMLRTADPRTIILLEGPSDCQAIDAHVDDLAAHTLPGYSKVTVERAIQLADAAALDRVLAILDLDWVGLLEQPLASLNVVYTDSYDLDATIFLSADVTTRVIGATTDRELVATYVNTVGLPLRDVVVRMAGKVGVGRFVSCRDGLDVSFRDFPVHVTLTMTHDDIDMPQMVTVALGRARTPSIQRTDLLTRIREIVAATADLSRYSSGHDIAAVLAHLAKGRWGGGNVGRSTMEQFGRAALSCAALQQTALYEKVAMWATQAGTRIWNCK